MREQPLPHAVRLPSRAPETVPAPSALALPCPADDRPYELAARRVRVRWTGLRGVELVAADGHAILGPVRMPGAVGANAVVAPRSAVRECFLGGRALRETVQLPEALPGVVVQWVPGAGSGPGVLLEVDLLPTASPVEAGDMDARRLPGALWVARAERGVLLHLPGTDAHWELRVDGARLVASTRIDSSPEATPLTLLAQFAPPHERWTSPEALAGVVAHHRRGEACAWGDDAPGLLLRTGIEEFDDGLRRTRTWIRDRLLAAPGAPPALHPLPLPEIRASRPSSDGGPTVGIATAEFVRAAAASGDHEAGRAGIASLAWTADEAGLESARALAAWVAWTGEAGPLHSDRERILTLLAADPPAGLPLEHLQRVRAEIAHAGEAIGDDALASLLGADVPGGAAPRDPMPGTRGMRLPTVGGARRAMDPSGPEVRARRALGVRTAFGAIARDPRKLGEGTGPASILELVRNVLGARPDAAYGRLELSPLLPPHWTSFSLEGVTSGQGAVDLTFERDSTLSRWILTPRQGSLPLTVVFRPWLSRVALTTVRIDGEEADLETDSVSGWTRVSLQLPVDRERVLEVEGGPSTPP